MKLVKIPDRGSLSMTDHICLNTIDAMDQVVGIGIMDLVYNPSPASPDSIYSIKDRLRGRG